MPRPTRNSNLPLADALDKTPTRVSKRHRQPSRRAQSPQRRQQEQEKDPWAPAKPKKRGEPRESIVTLPSSATEQLRRRKEQHRKDCEEKQARFKERDRYHLITREAREIRNNQEAESQRRREAR